MLETPPQKPTRPRSQGRGLAASFASTILVAVAMTACRPVDPPQTQNPVLPSISPYTPPPLAECDYPAKVKLPAWLPKDLPFPPGTYAQERLQQAQGYRRALLVIPVTLEELTRHVLEVWPQRGWVLGAGDSEPGEIEDQFSKPPAFGAFRAQEVICDPGYSLMYLIFTQRQEGPQPVINPTPRGSPLVPTPAPTG
jgi:hypothetical protein